jgi:hypothetical protein
MTTSFWSNEPSILFNKNYITQIWPTENMTLEEKLNAISRVVLILSILGFIFTFNFTFLIIGMITLAIIFSIYNLKKQKPDIKEGFTLNGLKNNNTQNNVLTDPVTLKNVLRSEFHPTTKKNPFGNVLLTDIGDTPDRLAAAPSFNPDVYDEINKSVKKQTQMLNPGIKNTNKQLYGDLKENYDLDNSMMRFYSTANTRVTNDQGAYANYLYGDMYSGKESTPEGAWMRVKDNYRYILI